MNASLDFITSPPTILLNSAMTNSVGFNEGTGSIADAFGNLLFYTDGVIVWNKAHQVMANGNGLMGDFSTTQAALIVKQPGSASLYYVFTLAAFGAPAGLRYSIVDMNLAAGMGSVTVKNTLIVAPSTEQITGVRHCNGTDVWIITHDYPSNTFRSQLLSSTGLSPGFTLTSLGVSANTTFQTLGDMKISPSGKKLGHCVYNANNTGGFEIYNFDNSTGVLSNLLSLPAFPYAYSCAFSPDETKFYGNLELSDTLYQWDLCAGSAAAIINSRTKFPSYHSQALQLAPNGKIYVSRYNETMLGVINNPNLPGTACNYVDQGQSVAPNQASLGFPNIINEKFFAPYTYTIDPLLSCNTASFNLPPVPTITVTACSAVGYSISSILWIFGDPASGVANTSTLASPTHVYPGNGTYTANLVYYYNNSCGGINTDTLKQEVKVAIQPIFSSTGFDLCTGNSLTLSATGATSYSWSTGALTSSIVVNPTVSTSYTLYSTVNGCSFISAQLVTVNNYPVLSISGSTAICPGFSLKLTGSGANSYLWSNGNNASALVTTPKANTTYTLYGNYNGCITEKTVSVVLVRPDIKIIGSTTLCPGDAATYSASGGVNYVWSTGESGNTIIITPLASGVYTLLGSDNKGCTNTASVLITLKTQTPTAEFKYDSPVCEKTKNLSTFTVSGFYEGGTFSSPFLDLDPLTGEIRISTSSSGTHVVNYFMAAKGCTLAANTSATVIINPAPSLTVTPETSIVPGASVLLSVSGALAYSWSPSESLNCSDCSNPIATPSVDTKYCVIADLNSCISKTCTEILISCETTGDYSLPNAFSPNNDGKNDEFCLEGWGACMSAFNVKIFDRWGEKVFESDKADFCWDGIYKGKTLPADVFIYVVNAKKITSSELINKKGNITLLR